MKKINAALIAALADGAVHSGADLAADLSCSRTAIWKHLTELRELGLEIDGQRGSGYQLNAPLELLDEIAIRSGLSTCAGAAIKRLEIHPSIASTSERLRGLPPPAPGCFDLVLAEYQSSGRGRRGRQWLSPFGRGLCLSLNWQFERMPAALSALSLAIGVAVCRALHRCVSEQVGLKWPNDIIAGGGKVGGLLVDVQGEADGPITAVVGFGLNVEVSADMVAAVQDSGGLPPVGLNDFAGQDGVARNRLAAELTNEIHQVLMEFEASGFAPFADEWRSYDRLSGRQVVVRTGRQEISGTARGIDAQGALLVDTAGELSRHVAGEVSLRPDPAAIAAG